MHVVTVRSDRPLRYRTLDGVPTAAPARALVDADVYGELAPGALRAATIATLQRRLSTADRVRAELGLAPANGSRPVGLGVADFERGAWSLPRWSWPTYSAAPGHSLGSSPTLG